MALKEIDKWYNHVASAFSDLVYKDSDLCGFYLVTFWYICKRERERKKDRYTESERVRETGNEKM